MRGNKKGCLSHGRHGRDPLSVARSRERQRLKYQADQAYRTLWLNRMGARLHGVTGQEYAERVSRPCEICGTIEPRGKRGCGMHVDHDHATRALRGTLCHRCNRGIGMFHDDPARLQAAADYIRRYRRE